MTNVFDYLKWRGDITMSAVPLCDADKLVLSELCYVEFTNDGPEPLGKLCREMLKKIEVIKESGAKLKLIHHKLDIKLMEALVDCPRFCDLLIAHCEKRTDKNREEQFAAMTVYLPRDTAAVVFRGTDWSLVGWKEDFNMAYCDVLPAQESAVRYLNRIGNLHDGRIVTMGHSKGGNLAVYASAFCNEDVSRRIAEITSLDGPGFSEKTLNSYEYRRIENKVQTYMPKASIVGSLFARLGKFSIIESKGAGVLQHVLFNWAIEGPGFVVAARRDGSGQLVEGALNDWINSLEPEQRRTFIDTVWSVIASADIDDFGDLLDGESYRVIQKNFKNLSEEQRSMISETLTRLRECAKGSLHELIRESRKK